ncbi:MAG: glycosyltransferase family 4 protein [Candidatus Dactylopiibacterium sp.]|nr:glycosyltransferase family 4 protein [Candidatus Dactylopiibacterium sp.]
MSARIHLLNPLRDTHSGSDLRTLRMFDVLREAGHDVHLWTPETADAGIRADYPVEQVRPWRLAWPSGGTLVIVGVYFRLGRWLRLARFERIVILYNTDQPDRLMKAIARAHWSGGARVEIVHTSAALREMSGMPGEVLESPVDLKPFLGIRRAEAGSGRPFVVGRVSRDCLKKHHVEDIALYRRLAARGVQVRILGGRCLSEQLGGVPNIELLEAGSVPVARFLQELDVFYYRTHENWFEAFGRVIFEAMAAGLPIVASRRGGYAAYLHNGEDALLFDSSAEALKQIQALIEAPARRAALGREARRSAQRICGEGLSERMLAVLCKP